MTETSIIKREARTPPVQGNGCDAQRGDEHGDGGDQGEDLTQQGLRAPRPETERRISYWIVQMGSDGFMESRLVTCILFL